MCFEGKVVKREKSEFFLNATAFYKEQKRALRTVCYILRSILFGINSRLFYNYADFFKAVINLNHLLNGHQNQQKVFFSEFVNISFLNLTIFLKLIKDLLFCVRLVQTMNKLFK